MKHTAPRAPRFDREWKELIELLPEHRRAVMEHAIREYQLSGSEPSGLEGAEVMAFMLIRKIVDRRARQRNARLRRMQSLTGQDYVTVAINNAGEESKRPAPVNEPEDKPDDEPLSVDRYGIQPLVLRSESTPRTACGSSQNRQLHSVHARRHRSIVKWLNRLNPPGK